MKRLWFIMLVASVFLLGCPPRETAKEAPVTPRPYVNVMPVDTPYGTSPVGTDVDPDMQSPEGPKRQPMYDAQGREVVPNKPPYDGPTHIPGKGYNPNWPPTDPRIQARADSLNRERQRRHDSIREANGGVSPPRKPK